jgi:small ligand-binding sensory domain FIST
MSNFAAALSEHPDLAQATGEAVGQVLERLGPGTDAGGAGSPDLALLFVTPHHAAVVAEAAKAVRTSLQPRVLVGCAAQYVLGGNREVERGPGLSLWAGRTGPVTPLHLTAAPAPDGPTIDGMPDPLPEGTSAALLICDPFTFPVDALLRQVSDLPGVGGMALAGNQPGSARLVVDEQVFTSGAVGVLLGPGVVVTPVVSQGCRPIGNPFVVTKAERNIVYELAGKPALERLGEVAESLSDQERALLNQGVHFGRVIDEHKPEFGRGDFRIISVIDGDPRTGAMAVGDQIEVGATAQFQVRDADSADEDLRQLVGGRTADAALLFTCNGRGLRLFGAPHHDATVVSELLDAPPLAGMFCAGELGPVGGRNFVHGFTASVVLLSQAGA